MPAYSYKERFVPMVLEGSKEQTVRGRRKHPPKIGQQAYNYFGMRTKYCRKLNDKPIIDVKGIVVTDHFSIVLYDILLDLQEIEIAKFNPSHPDLPPRKFLSINECNDFAWKDGFRPSGTTSESTDGCFDLMIRFWNQTHQLPWAGDVIYFNTTSI